MSSAHHKMCHMACCCCEVHKNLKELKKLSAEPKFMCMECGRVSAKKETLCSPKKL